MIRGALWDLDGTIADSGDLHFKAFVETLATEGVVVTWEMFLGSFGQKNDRILTRWLGADADIDRIRRIGDAKEAAFRALAATHGLVPLPGAAEWIQRLHDEGWKQAIASSGPRANIDAMLAALDLRHYFDALVTAEDVKAGKPDPEPFLTAASKLDARSEHCVVIEDAPAGVEAARRGGIKVIGVSALESLEADLYVRSLADLPGDAFDRLIRK